MKLFKRKEVAKPKFDFEEAYLKLIRDLNDQFGIVYDEIDAKGEVLSQLATDFYNLREHIANNGVVSDLAKLKRENEELKSRMTAVVRALNEISYELFAPENHDDVTIRGQVTALIEHLGIEVSIKPEEINIEPSKVVVKKAKKGKK